MAGMSNSETFFYGVGERVIDTLLIYALSDLARTADSRSTFSWNLGGEIIFNLHSSQPKIEDKMLDALKNSVKSIAIADRLNFRLNVAKSWKVDSTACLYCAGNRRKARAGGNEKVEKIEGKKREFACNMKGDCGKIIIPAYPVFFHCLSKLKTINWPNAYCISKDRHEDYGTLYMGLSPFWSKGVRRWDFEWDGYSSYVPNIIQALIFHALSKYTIIASGEMFVELIFSPPVSTRIEYMDANQVIKLVRRLVTRFSIGIRDINLNELPISIVPLVMLSKMDLPSIVELSQRQLALLFVAYSMDRGAPKNPRGYEERSLVDIANFYSRLGGSFWDFKCMIEDLVNQMQRNEFKHRVQNILMDFSYAISGRNLWRLNDALFKVKALHKDSGLRIHLLTQDATVSAQHAIETI